MSAVLWPGGAKLGDEARALTTAGAVSEPAARPVRPRFPSTEPSLRMVNVGLLGLGQVGQAVARLIPDALRIRESGLRLRVAGALVRDVERTRRCPRPSRLTSNPAAFLRGNYDVVIEALSDAEPARTLVARLLGRGVPVVTANKALVAAHGAELAAVAARRGTSFRYEASALAGVPFLGALAARPLVSDVRGLTAIVNGTSNFILTKIDAERCGFDAALAAAQAKGLTEPDPSRDLDGVDAANKLALLASLVGWGSVDTAALETQGIRGLGGADLSAARSIGATIKPLVSASCEDGTLSAFVGPCLVPLTHTLANLSGTLSGIQLSGRFVDDLFFSGPGAGPDVTAATIVDDAVEAVTSGPLLPRPPRKAAPRPAVTSPATRWFVRARFPGIVPDCRSTDALFAAHGLQPIDVTEAVESTRWVRVDTLQRAELDARLAALRDTHRIEASAIRAL